MNAYSEFDYLMFTTISAGAREAAALFWSTSRFPPTFVFEDRDAFELESMLDPSGKWQRRCASFHIDEVEFDLHWGYVNRPERVSLPRQLFFWEPRSNPGHAVMMGSSLDGCQHACYSPSKVTPWQYTYSSMLDPADEASNCMFDYFNDYNRVERHLAAAHSYEDRRWIFCQEGTVQPFENPDYYTRRKVRDRFNREIITEYMLKLGYDITHNDFWTTDKTAWVVWTDFRGTISGPTKRKPGIWSAND